MSGVFPVRPEWRAQLAAVTHVDGSARVQVLRREMAPRLHALLEAYGRRTGIPILGEAAARRFGVRRARFVETDLRHAGLKAGAFDVVFSAGVIHHTPDPRAAFGR